MDFLMARNIPAHDPNTPSHLIDLSAHFNAGLEQDWHGKSIVGNNLIALPRGRQRFGGVEFDVRGIIQLGSPRLDDYAPGYPVAVNTIKIAQRCRRLHFLQSTGWGAIAKPGTHVGSYRLHYADGRQIDIPLKLGEDFLEWLGHTEADQLASATVVWRGKTPRNIPYHLFKRTWENPRPETEIESIDFISTGTGVAPFLIAITAE